MNKYPWLKGSVSEMSSDSYVKMAMTNIQCYPWKLCLIKCELNINVSVSVKFLFFIFGFSAPARLQVTCAFLVYKTQWRSLKKNLFLIRKTHFWSDKGFKGIDVNRAFPSLYEGVKPQLKKLYIQYKSFTFWKWRINMSKIY